MTTLIINSAKKFIGSSLIVLLCILVGGCFGTIVYDNGEISGRVGGDIGSILESDSAGSEVIQTGKASWYGGKFHGRETASGEIFDKWDKTAAHRTIPLGTWLIVEHIENGRTVKVKVNDRGPFVEGRIIDLSRGAAAELKMVKEGVARVRLYGSKKAEHQTQEMNRGFYSIQVGSFSNEQNAVALKNELDKYFDQVRITVDYKDLFRVRVGAYDTEEKAKRIASRLRSKGYSTWIVRESPDPLK